MYIISALLLVQTIEPPENAEKIDRSKFSRWYSIVEYTIIDIQTNEKYVTSRRRWQTHVSTAGLRRGR